jgi:6-phosphogluconolactonase
MKRRIWMVAHGAIVGLAWPLHAQFVYVTNTKKGDRKSLVSERMRRLRGIFMKKSSPIVALAMIFGFLAAPQFTAMANQFVYVANKFDDAVSGYKIESTGALTPVPGSPFKTGRSSFPSSVVYAPHGVYLYVTLLSDNTIRGYRIDTKTGTLKEVPGSPFATGPNPESIAVDFRGPFAYVANEGSDSVSGYKINPTSGALTPVPGGAFPAGTGPVSVAVISSVVQKVSYLYVANKLDDTVSGYKIESTGALTPVPGSPFKTGHSPVSVTAVESDLPHIFVVYVANSESDTVSAYVADEATGTLNERFGKPFETESHPDSVATGMLGPRFGQLVLFVANLRSGTVSIYGGSGGIVGSVLTGQDPSALGTSFTAIDTSFVYVAHRGFDTDTVSGYKFNFSRPLLTPVPGSPFKTERGPVSIAVTDNFPF